MVGHSLPMGKCVTTRVGTGAVLFSFVKDLENEMEYTFIKFGDVARLGGTI